MSSAISAVFLTIRKTLETMRVACRQSGCENQAMEANQAMVPDLLNLYMGLRQTDVDHRHPLTAKELSSDARCVRHPLKGIRMYGLLHTADLMDRWASDNARQLAREQKLRTHQPKPERRTHDSVIVGILNGRQPEEDKPNPKHRKRNRPTLPTKRNPDAPKNYGTYDAKPKAQPSQKPGKGKKKGQQQNAKKAGQQK